MENNRHYAVIDKYNRKLTLKMGNEIVAESNNALILKEVGQTVYNHVFYFPKEDIKMKLESEDRSSFCPIKGQASYWQPKDDHTDKYFAWSYEEALPKTKKIDGYVAFNGDYVTIVSEPII